MRYRFQIALLCALPICVAAAAAPARDAVLARDADTPRANAAVSVNGCSGALIAPDVVLTAGHCAVGPRQRAPRGAEPHECTGMSKQAELQGSPWEDPEQWYSASATAVIRFGAESGAPRATRGVTAYALPRCADLALLLLDAPVPAAIARPFPILTDPQRRMRPPRVDALYHAGWGGGPGAPAPRAHRGAGPVAYWGHNDCVIVGLPPLRPDGLRLYSGDSGAPLLLDMAGGERLLVGILFANGLPDLQRCGAIRPPPPLDHGVYVATFRGEVDGTEATPIGLWLRRMVPEADHR